MSSYKICKTNDTVPITEKNDDKYYEDKLNNKTNLPLKEQLKTFKQDFEKMKNKEISYSTMRSIYG